MAPSTNSFCKELTKKLQMLRNNSKFKISLIIVALILLVLNLIFSEEYDWKFWLRIIPLVLVMISCYLSLNKTKNPIEL